MSRIEGGDYWPTVRALCPPDAVLVLHEPWISVSGAGAPAKPLQGWKLHLSAFPGTARELLSRAVPVLLERHVSFKCLMSDDELARLNAGVGGPAQIGKFLTAYPAGDGEATRLADALDAATHGLTGPRIPSDRRLRRGSVVHYRYGGFGGLIVQQRHGLVQPALRTPDGKLIADERNDRFCPPDWVANPFPLELGPEPPVGDAKGQTRYHRIATLSSSGRGEVVLGIDTERSRRCILKTADPSDAIALDKLHKEAEVLARLCDVSEVPDFYDWLELPDEVALVMEDIEGVSLADHVAERAATGTPLPGPDVRRLALDLAQVLDQLHARRMVHLDLKSTNVLVNASGAARLIDFETVADVGTPGSTRGTRGYMSPQQRSAEPVSTSDDVYGFGALLYLMLTGAEPSRAPDPNDLLTRSVQDVNPLASAELADLAAECLRRDQAGRPSSMARVVARLEGMTDQTPARWSCPGNPSDPEAAAGRRSRVSMTARALGDTLCAAAQTAPGNACYWRSAIPGFLPIPYRPINTGAAGVVLALSALVSAFHDERHVDALRRGCRWLVRSVPVDGDTVAGLHIGEAGVGAALLHAAEVLGDDRLIEDAAQVERRLRGYDFHGPDLFNGTAGRLRFTLMLWRMTGDAGVLSHADRCAGALVREATPRSGEGASWTTPPGYAGLSGRTEAGYAHGAAGIADALLDHHEETGSEESLACARAAARWVRGEAMTVLPGADGLEWGVDGSGSAGSWCRGAAGVGRLFLRLSRMNLDDDAREVAEAAGRTTARASRHTSPVLCHGLAGGIEYLLDLHVWTGDQSWLEEAWSLERVLQAFALERRGLLTWGSDDGEPNPGYLVGYSGVIVALLRLADPRRRTPLSLSALGGTGAVP